MFFVREIKKDKCSDKVYYHIQDTKDDVVEAISGDNIVSLCKKLQKQGHYILGVVLSEDGSTVDVSHTLAFVYGYGIQYVVRIAPNDIYWVCKYYIFKDNHINLLGDVKILESIAKITKSEYLKCKLANSFNSLTYEKVTDLDSRLESLMYRETAFDEYRDIF